MKLLILLPLCLTGCGLIPAKTVTAVAAAQTPAEVTGAGSTLVSPGNAKGQTTMTAQRRVGYQQPTRQWPLPSTGLQEQPTTVQPAWIDEKITTVISPHQDAAAIIKVAETAVSWSKTRWIGIALIIAAAFGLAWAHNNPEGYPMICWKVGAIGAALAIIDPSPWWCLLLLFPAGFYVAQKFKLINIPGII